MNTSGTIDGYPATLAVSGNNLVLNVVPEPSTAILLAVGVVALIGWAWRKRFPCPYPLMIDAGSQDLRMWQSDFIRERGKLT